MANIRSFNMANDTPRASHGDGGTEKVMRYAVTLPVTANADTVEFGYLPDYAVITGAEIVSTSAALLDVGITGDGDGIFDGITLVANVPQRTALSTLMGKNTGLGQAKVIGTFNGVGAAGQLSLMVRYVVEDAGVAYSFTAAV